MTSDADNVAQSSTSSGTRAGKAAFQELFKLLALIPRPKWATPTLISLGILASLAETAGIYLVILFLHATMGQLGEIVGFLGTFGQALLDRFGAQGASLLMASVLFMLIVARALIAWANDLLGQHVSELIAEKARNKLHSQLMRAPYDWVTSFEEARLVETLQRDSWMASGAYMALTKVVVSGCSLLVFTIVLVILSWQIALVSAIGALFISALVRVLSRPTKTQGEEVKQSQSNLGQQMLTSVTGMRTIRAYGQERCHESRFEALSKDTRLRALKLHRTTAILEPISDIGYLGILCAILAIASLGENVLAVGIFTVVLLFRMQPYVSTFANNILHIIRLQPQIRAVTELIVGGENGRLPDGDVPFAELKSAILFRNVSLTYSRSRTQALQNTSFEIPNGKTTAIIGASGAGKTTVVNLLIRLYAPDSGEILIGDIPLSRLRREDWLHKVAVAGQDVNLIEGSVLDNIRLSDSTAGDEEVVQVSREAGVDDFVSTLPSGYHTWIGQQGMNFSGGQRQRIGIARALLRNPNLLILDEAMSALDRTREEQIRGAIRSRFAGRTVLLITHRLETVLTADHVVCLHKGLVVAQGAPDVLMKAESSILKQWMDADVQTNEDSDLPARVNAAE